MHPILVALAPVTTVFVSHYVSSQAYSYLCVPLTVSGFFTSIITTASPICTGLLTVMTHTSQSYGVALAGGASWLIANVLQAKPAIAA